jgi:hypothetical protein
MTKKTYILLIVAAVLGGIYAWYFTDWIEPPRIQIYKSNRPNAPNRFSPDVLPVAFTLDGKYPLTSVEVLSVGDLATNKHPKPLWRLVTRSNSVPVKGFLYGQRIMGMSPAVTNARPQRLEPNVTYRLLVRAGRARGSLDFQAHALAAP